ncbi:MAG: heavy-metal-associated domain-containing protein [Alphaproteobacteria bacterium]|nr:heavy-metal-associated domain-containing protein [Alphaproteobacteria bacterium]
MRTLALGAALLFAAPALACPMADAAAFNDAAQKVKAADGTKVTLAVAGMHCGSCADKVTAAITGIDGVVAAAVDYQTGRTEIAFDAAKVKTDSLLAAVKSVGFEAKVSTES